MNSNSFKATFLIVALAALTACGNQQAPVVEQIDSAFANPVQETESPELTSAVPSKIIGANNLVKVLADGSNMESGFRSQLDAFGIISLGGRGVCTGTHIGNGYVITAGHCFLGESGSDQKAANKPCADTQVYWGYRGSVATGSKKPVVIGASKCTQLVYAEKSDNLDFALFRVNAAPKAKIAISTDSKRAPANTKITIFGYPQGRPLEWSQYCPLLSIKSIQDKRFHSASKFAYQCDTEAGNSGSTVLGISSSGTIRVVGVHSGASVLEDYNYATFITDIRKALMAQGFDLQKATAAGGLSI